jgi:CRP-like cAMP-binding protein
VARRSELVDRLAAVALFARCSKRELQIVARHAETAEFPAGAELVVEGEPGDAFFIVLEGDVVLRRGGRKVGTLGPGDYFGELALLDPAPRSATATTTTDVRVAVLGARMFRTLLRELPSMSERLLSGLARAFREAGGTAF